jgi:hypothetical protein
MSQYGAQAQALSGLTHADILGHWYPGTTLAQDDRAAGGIAVGLFRHVSGVDASRLDIQAAGAEGAAPIAVDLGGGTVEHLARPHVWRLRHDGDRFLLTGAQGDLLGVGPGPVRVAYGTGANSSLLRLPQLAGGGGRTGMYRWGELRVTVGADGALQPTIELPVEVYLRGLAEMPSSWQPQALQAQAIAGRGYAVRMIGDGLQEDCACHLGTTPHDQAYGAWAKEAGQFGDQWVAAVTATTGMVLTHDGEIAWTYYSSSHGGRTEDSGDSWAYPDTLPYLTSVEDPWSADPRVANPRAAWSRTIDNATVAQALGFARVHGITIAERTHGGAPSVLYVHGISRHGTEVHREFRGWRAGVAGADLKLALHAVLPSMQIDAITVGG